MVEDAIIKNFKQIGNQINQYKKPVVLPKPGPQMYEDPETAKLRANMLKILTYLVGGAAVLLIIWRVMLKFL